MKYDDVWKASDMNGINTKYGGILVFLDSNGFRVSGKLSFDSFSYKFPNLSFRKQFSQVNRDKGAEIISRAQVKTAVRRCFSK